MGLVSVRKLMDAHSIPNQLDRSDLVTIEDAAELQLAEEIIVWPLAWRAFRRWREWLDREHL
jgi:hypothetical protein